MNAALANSLFATGRVGIGGGTRRGWEARSPEAWLEAGALVAVSSLVPNASGRDAAEDGCGCRLCSFGELLGGSAPSKTARNDRPQRPKQACVGRDGYGS
jgi:hypothetical protein